MTQTAVQALNAEKAIVRRIGQHVLIFPAMPLLMRTFTVPTYALSATSAAVSVPAPLIWTQRAWLFEEERSFLSTSSVGPCIPKGKIEVAMTLAGLERLILEWLERHHFVVKQFGNRPSCLGPPRDVQLSDRTLLEFVREHDRGLIWHDPVEVSPADLIREIAIAWPDRSIIATATRKAHMRQLRSQLASLLAEKLEISPWTHPPYFAPRAVVATYAYSTASSADIERRDIYLAMNPTELFATDQSRRSFLSARQARIYGFLPCGTKLSPALDERLRSLFGHDEICIHRHGFRDRTRTAVFLNVVGGSKPAPDCANVQLKREGIWHHALRNRRIVKLVRLLTANDMNRVRTEFPDLGSIEGSHFQDRIALVVEGIEHALALGRHLPDAGLFCGGAVTEAGLSTADRELLRLMQNRALSWPRLAIATFGGLAALPFAGTLIRADGGTDLLPVSPLQVIQPNDSESGVVLIDFDDHHDRRLLAHSHSRKVAYRESGWNILGTDRDHSTLARFEARRRVFWR
ncbi:MAG: hypothetical protein ACJ8C4_09915 [Gemmataceae bacterium]